MALMKTITDESTLFHALKGTSDYNNNFTYDGANALQAYLEELSEDTGENIEFDPIAWCCEYTEYTSLQDFNQQYNSADPFNSWDEVRENTTVILFDGGAIVQDF